MSTPLIAGGNLPCIDSCDRLSDSATECEVDYFVVTLEYDFEWSNNDSDWHDMSSNDDGAATTGSPPLTTIATPVAAVYQLAGNDKVAFYSIHIFPTFFSTCISTKVQ